MHHSKLIFALSACLILASCAHQNGGSLDFSSPEDLSGYRVSTVNGSYYASQLSKRDDIDLMLFTFEADALQALLSGKADVMVQDETLLNSQLLKEYGIKVAFKGPEHFPTALMFRKDEQDLADAMNALLARMNSDGTMDSLKTYWLDEKYLDDEAYSHIPPEESEETLVVACISNAAPLSFLVEDDWYGLETDLARELARQVHRKVVFKQFDAASAMLALKTGVADVMTGCIFITPEREEEFLFSEPYHEYGSAYYVKDHDSEAGAVPFWQGIRSGLEKNLVKENRWKLITSGLWETLKITLLSILLGSILGIGVCAMARSRRKWLRKVAAVYNWFMAGIPMLVLLLILFYVVFAGSALNPTAVAVVAFALSFASGASGVYGTSLDAIPRGQTEAGLALGFTRLQTFTHIVLPQALKRGLPLYKGQCISILKGTSIVGYISIQDLTRAGDIIRGRTYDALLPLLIVTVIYFLLVWLLGALIMLATPKKQVL